MNEESARRLVLQDIVSERNYQHNEWGTAHDDVHTPSEWRDLLNMYATRVASPDVGRRYKALIAISAMAQASAESMKRRKII